MDFFIGILKQLAASLSPSEFLMVLILIATTIFIVVRFIVKNAKGGKGVLAMITGDDGSNQQLEDINRRLESAVSKDDLHKMEERIITLIADLRSEARSHDSDLSAQLQTISVMKVEIEKEFEQVMKQMDTIHHQMKMHDIHDETSYAAIRESIQKGQDIMLRIISQVEKIDEFIRTSAPEFRSYHKELSKEIGQLSKDIGIMDRVLQAQINTSKSGITLR